MTNQSIGQSINQPTNQPDWTGTWPCLLGYPEVFSSIVIMEEIFFGNRVWVNLFKEQMFIWSWWLTILLIYLFVLNNNIVLYNIILLLTCMYGLCFSCEDEDPWECDCWWNDSYCGSEEKESIQGKRGHHHNVLG